MSDFAKVLDASKEIEAGLQIDQLAELVESQISNVIGGGYSQYGGWHNKDAN
jgi:hypothetical protein